MLEAVFGPLCPDPAVELPNRRFLFLCFTNRCGSNYLSHLLATTGAFNEAGEFFNAPTVLQHARAFGLRSLPAYVAHLPNLLRDTGWIVAKAGVDQLVMLADAGILDGLAGRLAFLLLERNDRLGQAISRVIAAQTGRFTTEQDAQIPDDALVYASADIEDQITIINQENALFYAFFAANGIAPIHTSYETVLADPGTVVDAVAAAMQTGPLTGHPYAVRIGKQANRINETWRRMYEAGG
jgi:LPS sulfotransferase NodH